MSGVSNNAWSNKEYVMNEIFMEFNMSFRER
jgi:hypothetical protein